MSEWIRFEDNKRRNSPEFGTLMKDGRLCIVNELAQQSGVVPGVFVEVFYKSMDKVIALRVVPQRTPYSMTVVSTGPKDHPFDQNMVNSKGKIIGKPGATVSLRSFLNSRHIGLASKVQGHMYMDTVSDMLVFEIPDAPQIVAPSEHAAAQMVKNAFIERVTGDIG